MRPLLLGAVVACIVAACGSGSRGSSESIPQNPIAPTPPPPVVVHSTLSPDGDRNILELYGSVKTIAHISIISGLLPTMLDDFTSAVTGTIRTVSWQGGYCVTRGAGTRADSNSFHVAFTRDVNGRPDYPSTLYNVTLAPGETREQFAFEVVPDRDRSCYYYDYTAVLPRPFSVTAGTRYWLQIVANRDDANWSWRAGQPDNGTSAQESRLQIFMFTKDLAFALSSE